MLASRGQLIQQSKTIAAISATSMSEKVEKMSALEDK